MEEKRGNRIISKAISLSVVLIGIAVFYYYVIFLPKQEQVKFDWQKQEQQTRDQREQLVKTKADNNAQLLQGCLADADTSAGIFWESECKGHGLKSDCGLPLYNADRVDASRKEAKDLCFKQYPQK